MTTPSTLSDRLRAVARWQNVEGKWAQVDTPMLVEAADTLDSLQARVEAAENLAKALDSAIRWPLATIEQSREALVAYRKASNP